MEVIRIKKNLTKIILLLIGSAIFGVLCLNMFLNPDEYVSFIFRSTLFIKIFGLIGSVFTFIGIVLIVIKNIKKNYGLLITEDGIIDNSSVGSIGLILWKDVKKISQRKFMSTQFLLIDVRNPNEYLDKAKNKFILSLLKSNLRIYGTPLAISSVALKCNFDELKTILDDNYKIYLENHLQD